MRATEPLLGLVEGPVVFELFVLMAVLLFIGLFGMDRACKNDQKVASREWPTLLFFSISGVIAGLGLFFFTVVAGSVIAGVLVDITDPFSRLTWGIDYFVSILASSSFLFLFPFVLALWLKYQGDESMSRVKLFLITLAIVVPGAIIISLVMDLLFPGLP